VPHIGNIVGSHLPADIFARYCRLKGYETLLIGGTDENGTPTEVAAREVGVTPQKLVDEFHKIHKSIYDWFLISYDNFSRTSKPIHHKTTKTFFTDIYSKGYIIEKEIKVPFCKKCDMALPDRYVEGTCPNCNYEKARGDQCDKCTKLLDPVDLKKPKCKICGTEPKPKKTKHLFLDFSKLQSQLETWIKSNTHWSDQVTSLALGWIREGLKPRCITRDLKFGVQVPIPGYEEKVFYVWFDGSIGYVSSTKEWAESTKYPDSWELFWKNPEAKIYNFMGKDNIPFHTIFWPAMLIAYGKYNLPHQVVGLQFCNYEGDKISKSRNWGVFCERLPNSGIDPDVWRYYLSHLIPETKDSDFKWDEFEARVNNELIGNLGNFVNRALAFIVNHTGRKLNHHDLSQQDLNLIKSIENHHKEITDLFEKVKLREALQKIMELSAEGNKYLQDNKPWQLIKTDQKRCETVLYLS
ncbi:MAG TPA: methionine--tRNA ligase, partial [archaeon]|nr:methionine--tRNA ligase [archaeon]